MKLWKDRYLLGVDALDTQHQELFLYAEKFLDAIEKRESDTRQEAFSQIVGFLTDYIVYHFREEEKYQESIGFAGLEEHRKIHRSFVAAVRSYERRLASYQGDIRVLEELAGTLMVWLTYHVADADQRIVGRGKAEPVISGSRMDVLSFRTRRVLEKMTGLDMDLFPEKRRVGRLRMGEIFIRVNLTGGQEGAFLFGFSRDVALRLMRCVTGSPQRTEEMIRAALAELSNVIAGLTAAQLTRSGFPCRITMPVILPGPPEEDVEITEIDLSPGDLSLGLTPVMN